MINLLTLSIILFFHSRSDSPSLLLLHVHTFLVAIVTSERQEPCVDYDRAKVIHASRTCWSLCGFLRWQGLHVSSRSFPCRHFFVGTIAHLEIGHFELSLNSKTTSLLCNALIVSEEQTTSTTTTISGALIPPTRDGRLSRHMATYPQVVRDTPAS